MARHPRPSTPTRPGSRPPAGARPPLGARGLWPLRDLPALGWLTLAVAVSLVHPFLPESRWLMVHLVVLGALTHAVMVWSTHFSQALLKTGPDLDDRRIQSRRLLLLLVGTTLVLVGVPTAQAWLVEAGATGVAGAVLWHAVQLVRRTRASIAPRFVVTLRYYVAAALCLPVGAVLGAIMARGLDDAWQGRVLLAHLAVNVLGWIGLTVTGTLLTLWPTMLRTAIDAGAQRRAQQALPVFVVAIVGIVAGTLADSRPPTLAALAAYVVALLWWARALVGPARRSRAREFAPASVGAALAWWLVGLVVLGVRLARASSWAEFADGFAATSAVLVAGFAAQLLIGALSYLVPSVLGGGKSVVRATQRWFDRWGAARLIVANGGLALCLLPVPSLVRVIVSVLVLVALAAFVPLMVAGLRAGHQAKAAVARAIPRDAPTPGRPAERPVTGPDHLPSIWSGGQAIVAISVLVLALVAGVAADPGAAGLSTSGASVATAPVTPTGHTTRVQVEARGMRFHPASISVPAGDRLVVDLVNSDPADVHDLLLLGQRTPRLNPGGRATLDIGVVGAATQGWCTIVGHRQMGMTLDVAVTGGAAAAAADGGHVGHAAQAPTQTPGAARVDPNARIARPVDAALPPLGSTRVHRLTLTVTEVELEVAPGVRQRRWTYNGASVGPTLHGRVGDVFDVTLVNDGTMGHSIDFHAGALAPDSPMRTIPPGRSLTYRFRATRAGIWMYHCSTHPMSAHISAGMHGAVVIEPAAGLPAVDRQYVLVQSEAYVVPGTGTAGTAPAGVVADVDVDAVLAEKPTFVTFNGIASQYDQHQLAARVGERVRFWVLDAGPSRPSSFHIVGAQFDTVYREGAYELGPRARDAGAQALGLQAAQGGFVELTFPQAGRYPFVSHIMVDAERGAHGVVAVTP